MPSIKMKTHKGSKKRFKVTATGKVLHKRCGSSHLNSHKSGKQIRRLRKKSVLKVRADARRLRHAMQDRPGQVAAGAKPVAGSVAPATTAPAEPAELGTTPPTA